MYECNVKVTTLGNL